MKAFLVFDLPDEQVEFDLASKAYEMHNALWETRQQVFRPARKYGYDDPAIDDLLRKLGKDGEELVYLLEQRFSDIVASLNMEI